MSRELKRPSDDRKPVTGKPVTGEPWATNPFASRFVRAGAIAYRDPGTLSGIPVGDLLDHLACVRWAAIEGEHGTGKSTLLNTIAPGLQERFPGGKWIQLTRSADRGWLARFRERINNAVVTMRAQSGVRRGGVLVIDGAEQLPPMIGTGVRWRAWIKGQACLITTHSPQPGFTCLHRTSLNRAVMDSMLEELLGSVEDREFAAKIRSVYQSMHPSRFANARDLWSQLYDWVETNRSSR